MNERYLYRGKYAGRCKSFEECWVFGDLVYLTREPHIHPQNNTTTVTDTDLAKILVMHPVVPDTVGQCTGLRDKNGMLVFEGDFIKFRSNDHIYTVTWDGGDGRFLGVSGRKTTNDRYLVYISDELRKYAEIAGNIHDTPELLKEDNDVN